MLAYGEKTEKNESTVIVKATQSTYFFNWSKTRSDFINSKIVICNPKATWPKDIVKN